MAFIYIIENDINEKKYVGKTLKTIEERFKEHCNDMKRTRCEKRPLYNAMRKYGVEHFTIRQLEECEASEASIKEIYWIGRMNSYKYGYNATIGGDSKSLYDYREIADLYLKYKSISLVMKHLGCDRDTVRKSCKMFNINVLSSGEVKRLHNTRKIKMFDKSGNELAIFDSPKDAMAYCKKIDKTKSLSIQDCSHILAVCNGKRKSAYGYVWKYAENAVIEEKISQ